MTRLSFNVHPPTKFEVSGFRPVCYLVRENTMGRVATQLPAPYNTDYLVPLATARTLEIPNPISSMNAQPLTVSW